MTRAPSTPGKDIGRFHTPTMRDRFLADYDRFRERHWPADSVAVDIDTSFGPTRVYRSGPSDAPPMVLLSGGGGNALSWYLQVRSLSPRYRVYAVDTIGDAGRSIQREAIRDDGDLVRWLEELFDHMEITGAHVVGTSFGGWLGLLLANHDPDRVATLSLIEPGGFAPVGARFYTWVIASGLAGMLPMPRTARLWASRRLRNTGLLDSELMKVSAASGAYRRRLPAIRVLTDTELRSVRVPALVMLGERSALHRSAEVAARVRALMPDARADVVPDAGHTLVNDRRDLVIETVLEFTGQVDRTRGPRRPANHVEEESGSSDETSP